MDKNLIIIGASGHGKVVADIAIACGYQIQGFLDDDETKKECYGYPVLGVVDIVRKFSECDFVIAIGNNKVRKKIAEKYEDLPYITLIHPSAIISSSAKIEEGTVVMPNAVVNAGASIGKHCILNTAAIVEHDCKVENYVHLSPKAVICGTCVIGNSTWIGTGSTVSNNIFIASNVTVGAGGVVVKNIEKEGTYVGVPVRER